MTDIRTFRDILKEEMKERGISMQQLAELTEISPKYLRALIDSETENLPPAPYVRGYLQKIADVLETDFSVLWNYYAADQSVQKSGAMDTLPRNRYALRPINKVSILITGAVIILLAIFFPSITDFFGKPSLELSSPQSETTFSEADHVTIAGRVKHAEDSVYINDTGVVVEPDGSFSKEVPLSEGANAFDVKAKRFLGREAHITRTVFYRTQPTVMPSPSPSPSGSPEPTASTSTSKQQKEQ